MFVLKIAHIVVGMRWCSFCAHGRSRDLEIMFAIELKSYFWLGLVPKVLLVTDLMGVLHQVCVCPMSWRLPSPFSLGMLVYRAVTSGLTK